MYVNMHSEVTCAVNDKAAINNRAVTQHAVRWQKCLV